MKLSITSILSAVCFASLTNAQTISIKGSDTLGAKLIPQLSEAFKAAGNPSVKFEIAAEGSSTAFPALVNGTAQIGMSSRKIKSEETALFAEKGTTAQEHAVCHDMICVIVNKNSTIEDLTKDQVAKIFTGQTKDWSEVDGLPGEISIYTRNTSSGTYKDWQSMAMGGKDYPSSSQKMAGHEQIVQEVAKNKNGIGYVGYAYAKAEGIKVVSIDGVAPTAENAKKYTYSRPCYLYTTDKPSAEAASFINFIQTDPGLAIIRKVGFVPEKDL